jgi:hypothetical protein
VLGLLRHHGVTIDVGQDAKDGPRVPRPVPGHAPAVPAGTEARTTAWRPASQTASDAQRIGLLTQLGQLHSQGILTDSEFAAQKAQLSASNTAEARGRCGPRHTPPPSRS